MVEATYKAKWHKVVMLGATGAVGGHVLTELLQSPNIGKITTVGRRIANVSGYSNNKTIDRENSRSQNNHENRAADSQYVRPHEQHNAAHEQRDAAHEQHNKLIQHAVDLENAESYKHLLADHDVAVCTFGVGEPSKTTKQELWKIDVDYVMGFASACREQGIEHFVLMTAVDANAKSRVDYLRMKGTLEQRVQALGFPKVSVSRPSMIVTPQNRYGFTQAVLLKVWPHLNPVLQGPLRRYRGIKVEDLGRAIAITARQGKYEKSNQQGFELHVYEWDGFHSLLKLQ